MLDEQSHAASPRSSRLAEKFHSKRYRDGYVASHNRRVLARQMRLFRGDRSQQDFGDSIHKQQTVISRLEDPAYSGWSLRTMLEVAAELNVAVFARFVDFATFLRLSKDFSDETLRPSEYDQAAVDKVAREDRVAENSSALRAFFMDAPQQASADTARKLLAIGNDQPSRPARDNGSQPPLAAAKSAQPGMQSAA